ncbi:MAG: hypothetical protein WB791_02585 [Waddliaceae bacterium]
MVSSIPLSLDNVSSLCQFSLPESNVDDVRDAQVHIFLVNHEKADQNKIIAKALELLKPTEEDILLVEDTRFIDRWNFAGVKKLWENPEIFKKATMQRKRISYIEQVVPRLKEPDYPLERKIKATRLFFSLCEWLGLKDNSLEAFNVEELLSCFEHSDEERSAEKIKNFQEKALSSLNLLKKELFKIIVKQTFTPRQSYLISKIKECFSYAKVFLICGSSHGNVNTSNFPDEAERLIHFLQENTKFVLYDLNR